MRTMIGIIIVVLALLPFGAAMAQQGGDVPPELPDNIWVLTELNGEAPAYEATLTYVDGSLAGTTGCNSFSAPVTFDGESVEVGMGPVTLMACPEPDQAEQETTFLQALENVATFTLADGVLTFFDADGNALMVYEPALNPLQRADWVLAELNGESVTDGAVITADFTANGVAGSAGCNRYASIYTLDGTDLTFSGAASTQMLCQPESLMEQEAAYLAALETIASFGIVENQLVLYNAEGESVLVFDAADNVTLAGTEWVLTTIDGEAPLDMTQVTLAFDGEGVAGSAGCNRYFGTVEIGSGTISFGPLASTRMMCEEDAMAQEAAYLQALQSATGFVVDGETLTISGDGVELVFSLNAASADAGIVTVTVTYRERIALPPDATVNVQLQDISLMDAPAVVLTEETITVGEDSVPFTFELSYDPAQIDERMTYAVRAEIRDANDDLLFTTDTVMQVITGDNPTDVEIVLVSVE